MTFDATIGWMQDLFPILGVVALALTAKAGGQAHRYRTLAWKRRRVRTVVVRALVVGPLVVVTGIEQHPSDALGRGAEAPAVGRVPKVNPGPRRPKTQDMGSFHELPRNARRLIIGFAVLASAVIVIQAPEIRMWTAQEALAAALLALAAALTEQFTVSITHRTETENFSVTDALWVPALILAPGSVLIVSVLIGTVAGHAFRRWAWYKVVFNASQFVLAITAAQAVFHLFDLPPEFSLLTWVACVLAMSLYFTMNEVAVALIISQVEEVSIRKVLLLPGGLNLLHAAGNLTIGMLAALVWRAGIVGLPLLIAPVVLSFFAYKGWLQNKREQEERRERDRMSMLYEAGRALFGPLDGAFDFRPFLQLVRRVLDAAGAELVLREGTELHLYSSESGLYLSVPDPSGQGDPAAYVSAATGSVHAPVVDQR